MKKHQTAKPAKKLRPPTPTEQLRLANEKISAMWATSGQLAALSRVLDGLGFRDAVEVAVRAVAEMFHVRRGVLCFGDGDPPGQREPLIRREKCLTPDRALLVLAKASEAGKSLPTVSRHVPSPCNKFGVSQPRILIPLAVGQKDDNGGKGPCEYHGYLCLCQGDAGNADTDEMLLYKAGLVQEFLGAKLTCAALRDRAGRQSRIDLLTGICALHVLEERLQHECDRAKRYQCPVSVVVINVDGLRSINDRLGQAAGDQILYSLAGIMRDGSRRVDTVARRGDNEFVWLIPETGCSGAAIAAERLRGCAEAMLVAGGSPVTISCGVAEWLGEAGDSALNMLSRADAALFKAKRAGQSCVKTADEPVTVPAH